MFGQFLAAQRVPGVVRSMGVRRGFCSFAGALGAWKGLGLGLGDLRQRVACGP